MKANPYVYPFEEFYNLNQKTINWQLTQPEIMTTDQLKTLVNKLSWPKISPKGKTAAEKILNIFTDSNYLYGDKANTIIDKQYWIKKLDYFIPRKKPIIFTIHGFPFKIPNPLKSDRTLPDLGETLSIQNLGNLTSNIQSVYPPGAKIIIVGEGGFAKFVGVSEQEWQKYRNFIKTIVKTLGFEKVIKIVDISNLEKNPLFSTTFKKIYRQLHILYTKSDPSVTNKISGTFESVFRIISTRQYSESELMDIYNFDITNNKLEKIRSTLTKKTNKSIFQYHAYLMTRDELKFVQKIAPHSLPLSVSPKRGRLGIYPIVKHVNKLPYHGIPVLDPKKQTFSVQYLIDIKRQKQIFTPVFLQNDPSKTPFFYRSS